MRRKKENNEIIPWKGKQLNITYFHKRTVMYFFFDFLFTKLTRFCSMSTRNMNQHIHITFSSAKRSQPLDTVSSATFFVREKYNHPIIWIKNFIWYSLRPSRLLFIESINELTTEEIRLYTRAHTNIIQRSSKNNEKITNWIEKKKGKLFQSSTAIREEWNKVQKQTMRTNERWSKNASEKIGLKNVEAKAEQKNNKKAN